MTGNKELAMISEIMDAAAALMQQTDCSSTLLFAKQEAAASVLADVSFYRERGILPELAHMVYKKKMEMIKAATTLRELKLITKHSEPRYNGNGFVAGQFSVPEEEMIGWALASLKAPLMSPALERYMDLFTQVFGVEPLSATDEDIQRYREKVSKC